MKKEDLNGKSMRNSIGLFSTSNEKSGIDPLRQCIYLDIFEDIRKVIENIRINCLNSRF